MADKEKINSTTKPESGSVLGSTLEAMDEFDMNKINDVGGSHGYNNPSSNKGK